MNRRRNCAFGLCNQLTFKHIIANLYFDFWNIAHMLA